MRKLPNDWGLVNSQKEGYIIYTIYIYEGTCRNDENAYESITVQYCRFDFYNAFVMIKLWNDALLET